MRGRRGRVRARPARPVRLRGDRPVVYRSASVDCAASSGARRGDVTRAPRGIWELTISSAQPRTASRTAADSRVSRAAYSLQDAACVKVTFKRSKFAAHDFVPKAQGGRKGIYIWIVYPIRVDTLIPNRVMNDSV